MGTEDGRILIMACGVVSSTVKITKNARNEYFENLVLHKLPKCTCLNPVEVSAESRGMLLWMRKLGLFHVLLFYSINSKLNSVYCQ